MPFDPDSIGPEARAKYMDVGAKRMHEQAIDDAERFIRVLRHALPRALRTHPVEGVTGRSFLARVNLRRSRSRLSTYLNDIRPAVVAMDPGLRAAFGGAVAAERLDAVKTVLDAASKALRPREVAMAERGGLGDWIGIALCAFAAGCTCGTPPPVSPLCDGCVLDDEALAQLDSDRDGDGVLDFREALLGTDPDDPDTDGDGFDDELEDRLRTFGFDPLEPTRDSDRDGLTDEHESDVTGTDPLRADTDGDGYSDLDEVVSERFGFDPLAPTRDADYDGLADMLEASLGTDPSLADTDGDGFLDAIEHAAGSDPRAPTTAGGELLAETWCPEIRAAAEAMRASAEDERAFPAALGRMLPFPPFLEEAVASGAVIPSAALLASSLCNPTNSPAIYPCYNDVVTRLRGAATDTEDVALIPVGTALDGRSRYPIFAVRLSDNAGRNEPGEVEVLYTAAHHARELVTASVALAFIDEMRANASRLRDHELWVVPLTNPAGYQLAVGNRYDWRKNARLVPIDEMPMGAPLRSRQSRFLRGVDLNRNYAHRHATGEALATLPGAPNPPLLNPNHETYAGVTPFSEGETQVIRSLAAGYGGQIDGFRCAINWHSFGGDILYPWEWSRNHAEYLRPGDGPEFRRLADVISAENGYDIRGETGPPYPYPIYGGATDWLYAMHRIYAFTVEVWGPPDGPFELGQCQMNDSDLTTVYACFNPTTRGLLDSVVRPNVAAGWAFAMACREPPDAGVPIVPADGGRDGDVPIVPSDGGREGGAPEIDASTDAGGDAGPVRCTSTSTTSSECTACCDRLSGPAFDACRLSCICVFDSTSRSACEACCADPVFGAPPPVRAECQAACAERFP